MWQPENYEALSAEGLKYCAYVLTATQGMGPPQAIVPPAHELVKIYTHLSSQMYILLSMGVPLNTSIYYQIIPRQFHDYAFPMANIVDPTKRLNFDSICILQVVLAEKQIVEVAAMLIRTTDPPVYFHKLVHYACLGMRDKEQQVAKHGIPPMHYWAEELPSVKAGLRAFITVYKPQKIVYTQDAVLGLLEDDQAATTLKCADLPNEQKFAFASARVALNVKNSLLDYENWDRCPQHVHCFYNLHHAMQVSNVYTNCGALDLQVGSNCAHFLVNELAVRLTSPGFNHIMPPDEEPDVVIRTEPDC